MTYNLGTVGIGHWIRRLHEVLKQNQSIKLVKTVGTREFDSRQDELKEYGIDRDDYFRVNPGDNIPDRFFQDLDIVHIASPNKFHKQQTTQSLENGKVTITEKTFATSKKDFDEVVQFIQKNKFENRVTIHLHYLSKALTIELKEKLHELFQRYGKITGISATFFEKTSEEDARRAWLFKRENGGIFMDWIHPISIASNILKAEGWEHPEAKSFVVQPLYDAINPTAVETRFKVNGENFKSDSSIVIRVGKGFEFEHKKFRINFEDASVDLNYLNTEEEMTTGRRGEMKITSRNVQTIAPKGPLSYERMIGEILSMLNGRSPSLFIDDLIKIYEPEWKFLEIAKGLQPEREQNEIQKFIKAGLSNEIEY